MAYDATKKRQPGEMSMGQPTDPYSSLLDPAQTPGTSSAPMAGASGGATPTGYVNFDNYFNANADAAAHGAQQLQTSAGQKGQAAQNELGQAQSAFTGAVQSGTPQGPTGADFQRAQTGAAPPTVDAAAPARTSADTQTAPAGATKTTTQPGEQSQDAWRQRMGQQYQKAYDGYTGPNALSDTSAYDQLLKDTTASSDEANALASGNNGIAGALQGSANTGADAALLGAAGRQGFSDIGQKYGGGLNRLTAADAASQQQSDYAKQQAANDMLQYGLLAKDDAATQAAGQGASSGSVTDPASAAYWTANADNGNSNLQNLRTDNSAGYNATSSELGFGSDASGQQWVQSLPQILATGGGGAGSFGGNVGDALSSAEKGLGLSQGDLYADLSKMSNAELSDFFALGVIPQWMDVSGGYGKGVPGGWQSPYIQGTIGYGNDGGMWSAIENMWKSGASQVGGAIPVVGPIIGAGINQVKVGDSRKDTFNQ